MFPLTLRGLDEAMRELKRPLTAAQVPRLIEERPPV
jgi:hypothetical protein